MLHYVAGMVASDLAHDDGQCRYLIVQTNHGEHLINVPWPGWQRKWWGGRPGEYREAFTLFERDDADPWLMRFYAAWDDAEPWSMRLFAGRADTVFRAVAE